MYIVKMHLLFSTCILFLISLSTAQTEAAAAVLPDPSSNSLLRSPILRKSSRVDFLTSAIEKRKRKSLHKRDPFQTAIYNDDGAQYLIQVGIGSTAQNFTVTLDTGSADLWIPSVSCPSTACPHSRFNPKTSSTYQSVNSPFSVQYGIGTVKGTYAVDTVTIAGAQVTKQQFGLASSTSDILTAGGSMGGAGSSVPGANPSFANSKPTGNGILGLGYPSLTSAASSHRSSSLYSPVVFNMVQQRLIANPIFSIYMNKESEQGWAGEVIFGGVDASKFTGDLVYLPVAPFSSSSSSSSSTSSSSSIGSGSSSTKPSYYYWMVYGQGIAVKNTGSDDTDQTYSLGGSSKNNSLETFILDTGTTLTYFPQKIAQSIISAVAGGIGGYQFDDRSQIYYIDCAQASSSATVELQMSQSSQVSSHPVTLSVPVSDLVIPLDGDTADKALLCMFGIAPMQNSPSKGGGSSSSSGGGGSGSNMFLIGDSFLRSAYLVFDMGQNRVGIAAANGLGGVINGISRSSSGSDSVSIEPVILLPLLLMFLNSLIFVLFA
ncbi:aspartic peptidase domain-containing protein [Absidia repens]|uniref:Aspartic peptidase domain-containing protein n=1 Tax=Absidia repens TaxID=90262 RepID=A0A1X2IHE4_9FUNG|nr:aspartic peptidase domain-containing protein [Absidia repens]